MYDRKEKASLNVTFKTFLAHIGLHHTGPALACKSGIENNLKCDVVVLVVVIVIIVVIVGGGGVIVGVTMELPRVISK